MVNIVYPMLYVHVMFAFSGYQSQMKYRVWNGGFQTFENSHEASLWCVLLRKVIFTFRSQFYVLSYFKVNMYLMNAILYRTKSSMHRVQMFIYVCTF